MAKKTLSAVVIDALEDIKARDIQLVNVSKITSVFDYIAIASADSTRQTKALANNVVTKVKEAGFFVIGTEGEGSGEWVLVDCGDVVVHIMQPAIREYYKLEELWREGKLEFPRPKTAKPMPKAEIALDAAPKGRKVTAKASAKTSTRGTASAAATKARADAAAGIPVIKKPAAKKPAVAKPTAKKPAASGKTSSVVAAPVAKKPAAKKPIAKKPIAKKPLAKKPVAKKPAAKKPVAKKPAAKKPASRKRTDA